MDASKLMTKDWVSIDGNPVRTFDVHPFHIGYVLDGEYYPATMDERFDPIEITDEILSENFDNEGHDETMSKCYYTLSVGGNEKDSISVSLYPDGYYLSIARSFKYGQVKKFVKYVHEIQDAMRVCGLNDMADNFTVKKKS